MLNMCLCVDLILTLRNPFYPNKRRMKWFVFFAFGVAGLLTAATQPKYDKKTIDGACENFGLLTSQNSRLPEAQ